MATPQDDELRLKSLRDYDLLDSSAEECFDTITQLASRLFSTPIALISLIDENRQWFKARIGLDALETPRDVAFCDHAIRQRGPMVVNDAAADPRFAANPLVTGDPNIRFYCGMPLRSSDGYGLGTLCIIDRVPRQMESSELDLLARLARLVEQEFELRRRLRLLEECLALQTQRQQAKDLLSSMLVHDLRSPLSSIAIIGGLLEDLHPDSQALLDELLDATGRMGRMLSDVLDVCLGEAGRLQLRTEALSVEELVEEALPSWSRFATRKSQRLQLDLPGQAIALRADRELMVRVLTNLVVNAINYGPSGQTITLSVRPLGAEGLHFEVADQCPPVPDGSVEAIFRPFERLDRTSTRGHGLGLAFCRLAVEAHGGRIGVRPMQSGNRFYIDLPLVPAAGTNGQEADSAVPSRGLH